MVIVAPSEISAVTALPMVTVAVARMGSSPSAASKNTSRPIVRSSISSVVKLTCQAGSCEDLRGGRMASASLVLG